MTHANRTNHVQIMLFYTYVGAFVGSSFATKRCVSRLQAVVSVSSAFDSSLLKVILLLLEYAPPLGVLKSTIKNFSKNVSFVRRAT